MYELIMLGIWKSAWAWVPALITLIGAMIYERYKEYDD